MSHLDIRKCLIFVDMSTVQNCLHVSSSRFFKRNVSSKRHKLIRRNVKAGNDCSESIVKSNFKNHPVSSTISRNLCVKKGTLFHQQILYRKKKIT